MNALDIVVLAGDGIGPEVTAPTVELVQSLVPDGSLEFTDHPAGATCYLEHGSDLPDSTLDATRQADAVLLGAMGLPHVRKEDGTELVPQIDLRIALGLYAGVRPIRSIPGLKGTLANEKADNIDFVLMRESIEGLFASMHKGEVTKDYATDTLKITRENSNKLFDFTFAYAKQRKAAGHQGRVTCIDKANVFRSFAYFRELFDERARQNSDIVADHGYVDAMALNFVRQPWTYDVLVTENMFGDILSDLAAGIVGGMGVAPSADIGDDHAVFQPCHGTAPDIAGQGIANPIAMVLSAAMMLDWLGEKHGQSNLVEASQKITNAVDRAFVDGRVKPYDFGGKSGTQEIVDAISAQI